MHVSPVSGCQRSVFIVDKRRFREALTLSSCVLLWAIIFRGLRGDSTSVDQVSLQRRKLILKASYRGGNGRGLGELKYSILFRCEGRLQISSSEANGPGKQKGSTVFRIDPPPSSRRPSLTSCPNKHID
ncbi:unnamed protein product [Larinioides sclopetarius]|uniref:Uncharacterized protein n=1 Tax=Larinioides sclopetarius TaxID=280406 RepID=A0AAV2AHW5_9ARAC